MVVSDTAPVSGSNSSLFITQYGEWDNFTAVPGVTGQEIQSIDYDYVDRKIYWADTESDIPGAIYRCNINGSDEEVVITGINCLGSSG